MESFEKQLEPERVLNMVNFGSPFHQHDLSQPFNKREPLKAKLKEVLIDCAQRSTIHSVPSIAAPRMKILVRGLWVICFSLSCATFVYLSAGLVKDYLNLRVKTITYRGSEQEANYPGKKFHPIF